MGEHDALGRPGGAAGEGEDGEAGDRVDGRPGGEGLGDGGHETELPAVVEGAVVVGELGEGSGRAGGRVREGHQGQQGVWGEGCLLTEVLK